MKTKSIVFLALLIVFTISCGSDDLIPFTTDCKLTSYSSNRVIPSATTQNNTYEYFEDSVVNTYTYTGGASREVYHFMSNTIESSSRDAGTGELSWYATTYLNSEGYIDSVVRRNGFTDEINYRLRLTRNGNNQVMTEYISYITYGYDKQYFYNQDGTIAYEIHQGFGTTGTQNDSVVYTHDMSKPNNGAATYILNDRNGIYSSYHVTMQDYIDRTSQTTRRLNKYTLGPLDGNGNPTTILYEIDYPTGLDYSYERSYGYICN